MVDLSYCKQGPEVITNYCEVWIVSEGVDRIVCARLSDTTTWNDILDITKKLRRRYQYCTTCTDRAMILIGLEQSQHFAVSHNCFFFYRFNCFVKMG